MFNLNEAFDKLRNKVPTFAYEKRLSRIETLRLAITYISFMDELITATSLPNSSSNGNNNSSADCAKLSSHSPTAMMEAMQQQQQQQHYGYSPLHQC